MTNNQLRAQFYDTAVAYVLFRQRSTTFPNGTGVDAYGEEFSLTETFSNAQMASFVELTQGYLVPGFVDISMRYQQVRGNDPASWHADLYSSRY